MLLFADSFDTYGTGATGRLNMLKGAWAALDSGVVPTANGRTGANALVVPSGQEARLSLNGPKQIVGIGVGIWQSILPPGNTLDGFTIRSQSNAPIASITITTDGALMLRRGDFVGSVLAITDSVLSASTYNHIETKFVVDDIVGSCEIRVNGIVVMKNENINLGTSMVASLALPHGSAVGGSTINYDDLVIWDDNGDYNNDFLGPVRVLTLFATGDTAQADWSIVGTAQGFDAINEVPPDGDTTHLATAIIGDKSDFTLPALPTELASIAGVFVPAMARSDEAGISNIRVSMLSGSPENINAGKEQVLTPSYTYYRDAFEYDPATDLAWSKAGFEAAKIRIEKTL